MIYSVTNLKTYLSNFIIKDLYHLYPEAFKAYPLQKYRVCYWNKPRTFRKAYHHLLVMLGEAYKNTRVYNKEVIIYMDLNEHTITLKPYSLKEAGQKVIQIPSHISGLTLYSYLQH